MSASANVSGTENRNTTHVLTTQLPETLLHACCTKKHWPTVTQYVLQYHIK